MTPDIQPRPREISKWQRLFDAGMQPAQIAAIYHVSADLVARHVSSAGEEDADSKAMRPKTLAIRPQQAAIPTKWIPLYEAGFTIGQIASAAGVSYPTVRSHLLKSGVLIRPRGRPRHMLGADADDATPHALAASLGPETTTLANLRRERGRRLIDEATVRAWSEGYRNGATVAEIARQAGLSLYLVATTLRRLGVTPGTRGRPPGRKSKASSVENSKYAQMLPAWIVDYNNGASVNQIARKFELHPYSIQFALMRAGVAMRGATRPRVNDPMISDWLRLYQAGVTSTVIAKRFKVSDKTVRMHLKRLGIAMRPRGTRTATSTWTPEPTDSDR